MRSLMNNWLKLLRPHQWLKNLMLFFPPFLAGTLFDGGVLLKGAWPLISFCLASSTTYVINDILDREHDRHHPRKQSRPIACGAIRVTNAVVVAGLMLAMSLVAARQVSVIFVCWLAIYLLLSIFYSFSLKNLPIFDIFCIASGFVVRLFAGGEAFGVVISDWLFLSVMLLALFLSSGKRLGEKQMLGASSSNHRKSLATYPEGTLEAFMLISGAAVLVTYTMYVIAMHRLLLTVPLCCFGLFRYILLVKGGNSGDPTDSLVKDPVMFAVGGLWALMVGVSTYYIR